MAAKHRIFRRENGIFYIGTLLPTGKMQWKSTKTKKKSEAVEILRTYNGPEPSVAEEITLTKFRDVCEQRLASVLKRNTIITYLQALDFFTSIIGNKVITDISIEDVEYYKSQRLKKAKPVSLHIELRALRTLFNRGMKWGYITKSPFINVELPRLVQKSPAFIEREEFWKMIEYSKTPTLKDFFILAFYTGMRLGELLNLRWQQVNMQGNQLVVANTEEWQTKTGKERVLALSKPAKEALERRLKERNGDFVFYMKGGVQLAQSYVSHNFKRVVRAYIKDCKAKNEPTNVTDDAHFHSLRHSFCAACIMVGIDLITIRDMLGHTDLTMINKIYAHISNKHLHESMSKLHKRVKDDLSIISRKK